MKHTTHRTSSYKFENSTMKEIMMILCQRVKKGQAIKIRNKNNLYYCFEVKLYDVILFHTQKKKKDVDIVTYLLIFIIYLYYI